MDGMNLSKRQLFVESFEFPPGWGRTQRAKSNPKPKSDRPKKPSKQQSTRKASPRKPPLTPDEKAERNRKYSQNKRQTPEAKERRRLYAQEKKQRCKELGLCVNCEDPAKEGETRCEKCAKKHSATRRLNDAKRYARAKQERDHEKLGKTSGLEKTATTEDETGNPQDHSAVSEMSPAPERQTEGGVKPRDRREYHRIYMQDRRRKAKETGQCQGGKHPSRPGMARCQSCEDNHTEYDRRSRHKREAAKKKE